MRRLLPALIVTLALLPCSLAVAGDTKEFQSAGVDWTLPDGWSFSPVSSAEKGAGFFAKVECNGASVQIWAYAKPTEGLSLDERVAELKQAGGEGMGEVTKSKTLDTTLSGVKGKVVVQRIKAQGGQIAHFRKYVVVAGGRFYQLLMRCWHEAHTTVPDEINEVRAGFRLKKGAGKAKHAAEPLTEVDEKKGSDGGGGTNGGGDEGEDGDWPAGAPKRAGGTVLLDSHNMHWELSKASGFQWESARKDDPIPENNIVRAVWAVAKVERKKQEFEKNTPDHNFAVVDLWIGDAPPGFKGAEWVRGGRVPGLQPVKDSVTKMWGLLSEIQASKTRTKDEVKLGNHSGAFIKMEGKLRDKRRVVMLFPVVLRGKLYIFRAICWGHTDAYKHMRTYVGKALNGIKFLNTTEPVRGPLLGMIPDYAWHRGENIDKEKDYTGPGYTFEKPKGISYIKVRDSMNKDLRFVGEGRTEDDKAYIYFEIRTLKMNIPNQPNPDPEKLIEKRAQDWSAGAGDEASLGGKKLKIKKGKFGRAKGFTYTFSGHLGEEPVVEEGWVVKHKQNMLWIKMQFVGADAEKKLSKVAKALKKAMKFRK